MAGEPTVWPGFAHVAKKPNEACSHLCYKGGFVNKRHNEIRAIEAELLDEVCTSVTTEPKLQPLSGEDYITRGNKADEARLDISAVGFWNWRTCSFLRCSCL